ncbi:MAG: RibD family protein [Gammaproteobacteria bacterium]|nr:RibD family protein [Gammaproteobacteria bacterium]
MTTRQEIVEPHAAAACWRALTLLAEAVRGHGAPIRRCSLLIGDAPAVCLDSLTPPAGDGWRISLCLDGESASNGPPAGAGESRYRLDDLIVLRRLTDSTLPSDAAALLEIYLPYCMAPVHARRVRRSFTVSHFAQSLDGRIATDLGDSRWIGCTENLVHAHRMRALCDGILIGARTLRTDHPALTVRHAEGSDPIRIVVGGGVDVDIDCLARAGPGRILLIGEGKEPASPQVERLALPTENGRIGTTAILRELYRRDILSVYIEGGAATTSAFLAENNIDVLQLHISPLIIGPGISSFQKPAIRSVAESVRFDSHVYRSVGDGMLFVGRAAS